MASNNNYSTGQTTPNFAAVHADAAGNICLFTQQQTDLIFDRVAQTTAFPTTNPTRLLDTRVAIR